jgi:murein L,D-transpeptidase YafK
VRAAEADARAELDSLYRAAGIDRDSLHLLIRVLKHERQLEVWAGHSGQKLNLLRTYKFTAFSGTLGPKRAQGDLQIPEGVYYIDRFNPHSSYHLSLGLNYPNRSDRIRATGPDPGGDIFIHGNRVTIGCIPIGDDSIEELYLMCVDARSAGQEKIPVHSFPGRMLSEQMAVLLKGLSQDDDTLAAFWAELRPVYAAFDSTGTIPAVRIDNSGRYFIGQ